MTNEKQWPEPPAERQTRIQKKRAMRAKALPVIDTRTPSGKTLPY